MAFNRPPVVEKNTLSGVEWGIYYALIHESGNASVASDPKARWGIEPEEFAIVRKWLAARIAELHAKKP